MRSFMATLILVLSQWLLSAAHAQAPSVPPPTLTKDDRAVSGQLGAPGQPFSIRSTILSQTRRVNIALPASFESTGPARRYPVIIVFDGEYNFGLATAAAQYLAAAGQIPEALVVAVENVSGSPQDRVRDLTPPGLSVSGSSMHEGGDRFLDFLEKELLPALAQQFRAGAPCVLVGHSSGGILVTYAAATRSKAFPFIVSIDSPTNLQQGWLAQELTASAGKSTVALRYASLESRFGWSDKAWSALQTAAPAAWKLHREKLPHESHNTMGFLATYLGLREVFAEYSMLGAPDSPTSAALEYYRQFNEMHGLTLVPPRPLLARSIEDLLIEGNAARAQTALEMLIAGYGDTSRAAEFRAQIAEAAKLPPLTETVEDMLAAPMPTAEQLQAYLGEWEGTSRMNNNPPQPIRLRIEVKDGKVGGSFSNWPEPDFELVMPLQYLKIVPGGLHFGYMNGMRPRGMLVHEMVLHDGTLEGEMHMRGVNFKPPPSMKRPTIVFRLKKKK